MLAPGDQKDDELTAVTIRMPTSLHRKVKAKAKQEDRSMAQAIRHALRLWTAGVTGD